MIHQIAGRQRHADRVFTETLAVRGEDVGAGGDASARQRHIGGDHDSAGPRALRDPIVGDVGPRRNDDALDVGRARNHDRAVGDDEDLEPKTRRYAIDLVLHRTGVGVDIDAQGGFSGRHGPDLGDLRARGEPPLPDLAQAGLSTTPSRATNPGANMR